VRQTTNPQGPGSSDSISAAAAVRSTGGSLPKPAAVLLGQAAPAAWLTATVGNVAEQLALDEALLEAAHAGHMVRPVVRTWMAAEPTVVVGSSSRIDEEVDRAACAGAGIPILRRPSGGLTVVLGPGCLMWSVVAPIATAAPAIDRIHSAILDPLAAALATAGRPVVRRGSSDLALATADGERKVSGNALRVRRGGVLYHGTLLDAFDLASTPGAFLPSPPKPLSFPRQSRARSASHRPSGAAGVLRGPRSGRLAAGAGGGTRSRPLLQPRLDGAVGLIPHPVCR